MSEIERKMEVYIDEANANYEADRFKDAAKTFEHLIPLALQNNEPEEAIYFGYRAADCWKKDKNEQNRASLFKLLANVALESAASIAQDMVKKTKDKELKAKALLLAGECLTLTQPKKAKQILKKSMDLFLSISEKEKNADKVMLMLQNASRAAEISRSRAKSKNIKVKLANFKINLAESFLESKSQDNLSRALREYEDALDLLTQVKETQNTESIERKIADIKKKVANYDPFAT